MERQRFEVTLRCGGGESVMWTNRLTELHPVLELAITGSQSDWRMACAVRDTTTKAYAEVSAETSIGFWPAVRKMLAAVERCEPRRLHEGAGRDVVVEVQFAAHDATLEQCRDFVAVAISEALATHASDEQPDMVTGRAKFSWNGPNVGEAWFQ